MFGCDLLNCMGPMSLQNLYIHRSRYAPTILQEGTGTYSFEGIPVPHPAPPHSNHSKAFVPPTLAMESWCQPEAVRGWTCEASQVGYTGIASHNSLGFDIMCSNSSYNVYNERTFSISSD